MDEAGDDTSASSCQRRSPTSPKSLSFPASSLQRCKLSDVVTGQKNGGRVSPASSGSSALRKEITLFTGVSYMVGGMIGSGVFVTPRSVLATSHSFGLSLVIWILGGVIAMCAGLCYIELGLLIRKSGVEYNFLKEAYTFKNRHWVLGILGEVLGFMYLWATILLIRSSSQAVVCLTSARYLVRPFFHDTETPEGLVVAVGIGIVAILALVNCYGLKSAARLMSVFTVCKLLTVAFVVLLGGYFVVWRSRDVPQTFWHPFENLRGESPTLMSVALSFYSVLFAYDGWNAMNFAIEETKDVHRTMPLSIYIGVSIVMISYCLVNISFFAVLTYEQISSAVAVALPFGEVTLGPVGLLVIPLLVAASAFGAANGSYYNSSRLMYVAAREGHAPKFLAGLHVTTNAPVAAVLLQFGLCVVVMLMGSIEELIRGVTYSFNIFICLSILGLFILRKTRPEEPRLFPAWFILPIAAVMVCVCVFLLLVPLLFHPLRPLISLLAMLSAVPVYILFVMEEPYKLRPKFVEVWNDKIADFVGSILNTQPAD